MGNLCKMPFNYDIDLITTSSNDSPREKYSIKKLEEIIEKIKNIPIFKRKPIFKEKFKLLDLNIINYEAVNANIFIDNYIQIFELLNLNNTDKNIVLIYLKFIKINQKYIKIHKLKSFDEEINKYKLVLTIKELDEIEKGIKKLNEKDNFINFLQQLTNDDTNKIFSNAKKYYQGIKYFNYPIEFFNEELFYYKLYTILVIQINKISLDKSLSLKDKCEYISNKKKVVNFILDKKILYNEKIINNEDNMNFLFLLILYDKLDDNNESINFNRLLQTEEINYQDLIKYINDKKIGEITEIDYKNIIHLKYKDNDLIEIFANKVCFKNLNLKNKNRLDLISDINKYNTFNKLCENNEVTPYNGKIKNFLIKIINSNVYREAIQKLFPQKYNRYLLGENLKDIEECINSRFKFYPCQELRGCGFTDKFSCYSYICALFNIFSYDKTFFPILRAGAIIDISLHEINHLNQDIIFFVGNDKTLFDTPKRKFLKGVDGGENLEEILFGKKIETLKILECFYLLNENNYNQSLNDFKTNFQNLYDKSVDYSEKIKYIKNGQIDAIFKDFFDIIKNYDEKDFIKIELYGINTKTQSFCFDQMSIYLPKEHCKLGD